MSGATVDEARGGTYWGVCGIGLLCVGEECERLLVEDVEDVVEENADMEVQEGLRLRVIAISEYILIGNLWCY